MSVEVSVLGGGSVRIDSVDQIGEVRVVACVVVLVDGREVLTDWGNREALVKLVARKLEPAPLPVRTAGEILGALSPEERDALTRALAGTAPPGAAATADGVQATPGDSEPLEAPEASGGPTEETS